MKKIIPLGLFLLALSLFAQQKPSAPKNIFYEIKLISPKQEEQILATYKSGDNYRLEVWELKKGKKKLASITLQKGDYIYVLSPEDKTGIKMKKSQQGLSGLGMVPQHFQTEPDWDRWVKREGKKYGVKKLGSQSWEGHSCEVYRAMSSDQKSYVDLYVDRKSRRIVRWLEYDAGRKEKIEMHLLKYEMGKPLKKELFEIPSGYQIQELPMMPMMPQNMPPGAGKP